MVEAGQSDFLLQFEPVGNSWRLPIGARGKILDAHVVPHCATVFNQTLAQASKRRAKSSFFFFTDLFFAVLCSCLRVKMSSSSEPPFWATKLAVVFVCGSEGQLSAVTSQILKKFGPNTWSSTSWTCGTTLTKSVSYFKVNNTLEIILFLVISGFKKKTTAFFSASHLILSC